MSLAGKRNCISGSCVNYLLELDLSSSAELEYVNYAARLCEN